MVCRIEENKRIVVQRIVNPSAQLLLREHCSCWIVGIAEVDHVDMTVLRYLRNKAVLSRAGHIGDVAPPLLLRVFAVGLEHSGPAYHHVGVDVDGIDGVGNADGVVPAHQFLNVSGVGLGSVVDENLVEVEVYAAREKVVLEYGLAQEVVALLGSVAAKALPGSHLVGGTVHGLYHRRAKGLRHVAYAERDDVGLGMSHLEGVHLLCYIGKQVVAGEFQEMFIY